MGINFKRYYKNELDKLERIFNQFINKQQYKDKGIVVNKGVLIVGPSGSGKTALLNKIKENSKYKTIVYDSKKPIEKQITDLNEDITLLLIDDIDLMLKDNKKDIEKLCIILNNEKDNFDNMFVISTSSKRLLVNESLIKSHCVDEVIELGRLNREQKADIFIDLAVEKGISFKESINKKYLQIMLSEASTYSMNQIINHLVLTYGFNDLTEDNLYNSINDILSGGDAIKIPDRIQDRSMYVAVHEAGHALMTTSSDILAVAGMRLGYECGRCCNAYFNDDVLKYEALISRINTGLAGIIATKLIFNKGDIGCSKDLECARSDAAFLVNRAGYKGAEKTLAVYNETTRHPTEFSHYNNEKEVSKILAKQERYVKKYLKKNKAKLLELADALYEKGRLNIKEVYQILEK